jgi:hypothetical protein
MKFAFDVLRRLVWFLGLPYATFWSIQVLSPSTPVAYTVKTFVAFWLLFWIVRWMVQNIRHGDWTDVFSIE